jgi:hypothetical protein
MTLETLRGGRGGWRVIAAAVVVATGLATPVVARADDGPKGADATVDVVAPETPAGRALAKVLARINDKGAPLEESSFSAEFLKAVPLKKVVEMMDQMRSSEGAFVLVAIEEGATPTKLVARLRASESGKFSRLLVVTDDAGVMRGLRIMPAPDLDQPPVESWAALDERLLAAAPSVGFAVWRQPGDDKGAQRVIVHGLRADEPLAVGSTFKLYVLGALVEKIQAGELTFDTKLKIRAEAKSLPSGVMQNLPDGTEKTVAEFAKQMISISDNTATDHLIDLVGREAVEAYYLKRTSEQGRTLPFLKTMEMFRIKLAPDRELAERYAEASVDDRRAALMHRDVPTEGERLKPGQVAASEPNLLLAAAWKAPVRIDDVEWFVSADDACRVMSELVRLSDVKTDQVDLTPLKEILGTNPGLAFDSKVWKVLAYKGGSEPGVLNLTWALKRADDTVFCVSLTVNDPKKAIRDAEVMGLAMRAVEFLGTQP